MTRRLDDATEQHCRRELQTMARNLRAMMAYYQYPVEPSYALEIAHEEMRDALEALNRAIQGIGPA